MGVACSYCETIQAHRSPRAGPAAAAIIPVRCHLNQPVDITGQPLSRITGEAGFMISEVEYFCDIISKASGYPDCFPPKEMWCDGIKAENT